MSASPRERFFIDDQNPNVSPSALPTTSSWEVLSALAERRENTFDKLCAVSAQMHVVPVKRIARLLNDEASPPVPEWKGQIHEANPVGQDFGEHFIHRSLLPSILRLGHQKSAEVKTE